MTPTTEKLKEAAYIYISQDLKNVNPDLYQAFKEKEHLLTEEFYKMLGKNILLFYNSTFIKHSATIDHTKEISIILFYIFKLTLIQYLKATEETENINYNLPDIIGFMKAPRSV